VFEEAYSMMDLLLEAVVLSFVLGGMLGAAVAAHLSGSKVRAEQQVVELVRRRSRS
jgi:hypothetical protein